jgi:hypothetical protein
MESVGISYIREQTWISRHLHLAKGDKIILFQDENDFEVAATLDIRHVDVFGNKTWVAIPEWSTLERK